MNNNKELRSSIEINIDAIDYHEKILHLKKEEIPYIVLVSTTNERTKRFYFGAFCFIKPIKYKTIFLNANEKHICTDRIDAIKFLLNKYCLDSCYLPTIIYNYKEAKTIFDYLDENCKDKKLNNIEDAKEIYLEFTKFLLNKINTKRAISESVNTEHYKKKQILLAEILAASSQMPEDFFKNLVRPIVSTRPIKTFNFDEDSINHKINIKVLLAIFNQIYNFIMEDKKLPLVINLKDLNMGKYYIDTNLINRTPQNTLNIIYQRDEIIEPTELNDYLNSNFGDHKKSYATKKNIRRLHSDKITKLIQINNLPFDKSNIKTMLSNFLIVTFSKLLIASTGANESCLYNLKLDSFITIGSDKGKRSFSIKSRAKNKKVFLEFGLKFLPLFNNYIKFRKKLNFIFNDKLNNEQKNLLFIKLPTINFQSNGKIMKMDSVMFDNYHRVYKRIFKQNPITNKELRLHTGNFFLNHTNSINLTSKKLNNTSETVMKNYMYESFEVVAEQFSTYFKKLNESVIFNDRLHKKLIPVNISNNNNDVQIPLGNCAGKLPEVADGFHKDKIKPNCLDFEGCLFCKNFALHLDLKDIRKICSLLFILEKLDVYKENIERILFRIREILFYVSQINEDTKNLVDTAQIEVNKGYVDPFWDNHLNLLIKLGFINE